MDYLKFGQVLASNVFWRATGSKRLGRSLIRALESEDEMSRTAAGMCLVGAQQKARPVLIEALDDGKHLPMVIGVLGSIGDERDIPKIQQYTQNDDVAIATAANSAIEVMRFNKGTG